jgi:sterol desaturase/sphingolipid hydroxylase (fatty acid hydroxylase superfamily)
VTRAIVFTVTGALLFLVELAWADRRWPRIAGWWARSLLVSLVQLAFVLGLGLAWDGGLSRHSVLSSAALGDVGGGVVGYVAITFVNYWWHRARHEVGPIWRWLHQLHHSPRRVELITSFYRHPLEIVINGFLMSAVLYAALGATPGAAANAVLLVGLVDMFYHTNVRTPVWLGFLVQRPESHCVHHHEGVHSYNYADLPVWDMLFGTFRNPRAFHGRCGFGGDESRVGAMLLGAPIGKTADLPERVRTAASP